MPLGNVSLHNGQSIHICPSLSSYSLTILIPLDSIEDYRGHLQHHFKIRSRGIVRLDQFGRH
jgi:hypothetical protein